MQVEAILSNKTLQENKNNNKTISNLFESENRYSIKDRLMLGQDTVESSLDVYTKNDRREEETKQEDMSAFNPVKISKENLEHFMNSVSTDDFDKYAQLGIIPEKEDPGNLVTVSERIKIQLMTYSDNYQNPGLPVSFEDIEAYASDAGIAYSIAKKLGENNLPVTMDNIEEVSSAVSAADSIQSVNDSAQSYLLKNHMDPSIQNVYLAVHSARGNSSGRPLTGQEWENIKPQAEKLMQEYGVEANEQNLDNAKWIIEKNMPLTVENLSLTQDIKEIELNQTQEQMIDQIVSAKILGKSAKDTLLVPGEDILKRAAQAVEILNNAGDKQLGDLLRNNQEITIANLNLQNSPNKDEGETNSGENYPREDSARFLTAKKQLEEIRLKMTLEAGVQMLNKGIKIEITPLKELVQELEELQNQFAKNLFDPVGYIPAQQEISTLETVEDTLLRMSDVPNYIIGQVVKKEIPFTLEETVQEGEALKEKLKAAGTAYETLGTRQRRDLGDSINKAFSSIDGILEEMNLENNESNQRAVRILAYNQMELTQENIMAVKQTAQEYERLSLGLKPRTTAYMIAGQINPLNTQIDVLNDYIDEVNNQIGGEKEEKYSEFLWKLQKDVEITSQERDAYIGVYRLLNMVQKGDYAVIGALVKQGAEMTLKNLASGVKTKNFQNGEASLEDGVLQEEETISQMGKNLLGQLSMFEERYYKQTAKTALENATPSGFKKVFSTNNIETISLEKFQEELIQKENQEDKAVKEQYDKQRIQQMGEIKQVSDSSIQLLLGSGQKVSAENIMAAGYLLRNKKGLFEEIENEFSDTGIREIQNSLEDSETAEKAYEDFAGKVNSAIDEKFDHEELGILDIQKLKQIHNSVNLMTSMSKKNSYHVPIEVKGEMCAIRLTLISGSEEYGKISVEMDSEKYGKVSGEFKLEENVLKGIVLSDSNPLLARMQSNMEEFCSQLEETGIIPGKIDCCMHESITTGMWGGQSTGERPPAKQLYQVSKMFIKSLKQWAEDAG